MTVKHEKRHYSSLVKLGLGLAPSRPGGALRGIVFVRPSDSLDAYPKALAKINFTTSTLDNGVLLIANADAVKGKLESYRYKELLWRACWPLTTQDRVIKQEVPSETDALNVASSASEKRTPYLTPKRKLPGFGLWAHKKKDALEIERELRDEWA